MRNTLQKQRGGADSTATMVSVGTQTPWSYLSDTRHQLVDDGCDIEREEDKASQLENQQLVYNDGRSESVKINDGLLHSSESVEISHLENSDVSELVDQLTELQFVNGYSSDDEEEEEEEEDVHSVSPPYPDLPTSQLSWPAILQYLRESESEASKYFSLDYEEKKSDVERLEYLAGDEKKRYEDGPIVERMSEVCDFCGQSTTHWSVLQATTGTGELALSDACCWRFKEYCLLVAACLRQLIANSISSQPTMISVALKHKKDFKKSAEDRAYDMMRRRKRWEERRQRKQIGKKKTLQSSSFYSLTKQTKTIQFSLVSSAVLKTGWMMEEREGGRVRGRRVRKKKNKNEKKLPNHILNMLKKTIPLPQALDVRTYHHDDRPFCTLLPDHTGQY